MGGGAEAGARQARHSRGRRGRASLVKPSALATASRLLADDLGTRIQEAGFRAKPVTLRHVEALRRLPVHHNDPFDRMLIAQAQVERLTLVTHDAAMAAYDVDLLQA